MSRVRTVRDVVMMVSGAALFVYSLVTASSSPLAYMLGMAMLCLPIVMHGDRRRQRTDVPGPQPRPDADVAQYLNDDDREWLGQFAPGWTDPTVQAAQNAEGDRAARLRGLPSRHEVAARRFERCSSCGVQLIGRITDHSCRQVADRRDKAREIEAKFPGLKPSAPSFASGGPYEDRDDQRRMSSPRPGWQVERETCEGQRFVRVRHDGVLVGGGRNLDHLTDDEIVQQVIDKSGGDPAAQILAGMAWARDRYGDAPINPSLIAEHKIEDGAFDTVEICAWGTGRVVRRESTGR